MLLLILLLCCSRCYAIRAVAAVVAVVVVAVLFVVVDADDIDTGSVQFGAFWQCLLFTTTKKHESFLKKASSSCMVASVNFLL